MDLNANIAYAVQLCDAENREINDRICGNNRTLLSKKSIKSFFNSVEACAKKHNNITHNIKIFNDRSTEDLLQFINYSINKINYNNISITVEDLPTKGIVNSILSCYKWMQDNGKDFVYQIQDDYLFFPNAITELIELQFFLKKEINDYAILTPFHDVRYWKTIYKNIVTPRVLFCSDYRYWIQLYDISCSFLIHHSEFSNHWDLYNDFFSILESKDINLENRSLNYMLVRRGKLALTPINTLAFHMQSEFEEDPYIKWQPLWENIDVRDYT